MLPHNVTKAMMTIRMPRSSGSQEMAMSVFMRRLRTKSTMAWTYTW